MFESSRERPTDPLARPRRGRGAAGGMGTPGVVRPLRHVPPGWPEGVPPPEVSGWQETAVPWLLDHCPADYRGYAAWRRYPLALAWVAVFHVEGQIEAMREAYRAARVDLGEELGAEAVREVLADLEREGVRLLAARRSAHLVLDAMQGKEYVPRL